MNLWDGTRKFQTIPPSADMRFTAGYLVNWHNISLNLLQHSDETEEEAAEKKESEAEEEKPDPITQLITCLSRAATKEQQSSMPEDDIYISYAQIMSQVIAYILSRIVRKPDFCLGENKGADQLRGNREADQRLCFRYTDSTISLLLKSEISSF